MHLRDINLGLAYIALLDKVYLTCVTTFTEKRVYSHAISSDVKLYYHQIANFPLLIDVFLKDGDVYEVLHIRRNDIGYYDLRINRSENTPYGATSEKFNELIFKPEYSLKMHSSLETIRKHFNIDIR